MAAVEHLLPGPDRGKATSRYKERNSYDALPLRQADRLEDVLHGLKGEAVVALQGTRNRQGARPIRACVAGGFVVVSLCHAKELQPARGRRALLRQEALQPLCVCVCCQLNAATAHPSFPGACSFGPNALKKRGYTQGI